MTGQRGMARRACLRNARPRVPTSISQRRQRSRDYTIKRFPTLQIAQCQFLDLNNSMNQKASTDRRKAEDRFTDIGFCDHSIPFGQGRDKSLTLAFLRPVNQGATLGGFVHHPHDVTPLPRRRPARHIVPVECIQQVVDGVQHQTGVHGMRG